MKHKALITAILAALLLVSCNTITSHQSPDDALGGASPLVLIEEDEPLLYELLEELPQEEAQPIELSAEMTLAAHSEQTEAPQEPAVGMTSETADDHTSTELRSSEPSQEPSSPDEPPAPRIVQITISAVGDCIPGNEPRSDGDPRYPNYMMRATGDYGHFFRGVQDIFASDDLTIANLEGVLSTCTDKAEGIYHHRGDPENIRAFSESSVEVLNLANNHTGDFLDQGYADTVETVTSAGIICVEDGGVSYTEVKGIKIALVGNCYNNGAIDLIGRIREEADLVIFMMHCGDMNTYAPNQLQINKARWAIASGADLVLGHHPHVLQPLDEYMGKRIVYSLGNFSYGGTCALGDYDTMIYQQTFTFIDGELSDGIDDRIIPCSVSSSSEVNDYRPTPYAPGSAQLKAFWEKFDAINAGEYGG